MAGPPSFVSRSTNDTNDKGGRVALAELHPPRPVPVRKALKPGAVLGYVQNVMDFLGYM